MWWKLNIWSNLLAALGAGLLALLWAPPVRTRLWCAAAVAGAAVYVFRQAAAIYGRYGYKVEVYRKMRRKASERFDRRYFIAYMGSPCMRSVVWFVLRDLGRTDEYRTVRRLYKRGRVRPIDVWFEERSRPKTIALRFADGRLQFKDVT